MIHTGPIHIEAHQTEDGECEECEGDCTQTESRDYPNFHALLAEGWAWDCVECGTRTDEEEDADGNELELDPVCTVYTNVNEPSHVFCTPACHDAFFARAARVKADKLAMTASIARLWPDAVKVSAHIGWIDKSTAGDSQAIAVFELPAGLRVRPKGVFAEHRLGLERVARAWQQGPLPDYKRTPPQSRQRPRKGVRFGKQKRLDRREGG